MGLPKVIELGEVNAKVKKLEGVQWKEDASNTLDVIKQFFPHVMVYDSGNGSPKIVVMAKNGVVTTQPGWWFLQDDGIGVLALDAFDFEERYALKK